MANQGERSEIYFVESQCPELPDGSLTKAGRVRLPGGTLGERVAEYYGVGRQGYLEPSSRSLPTTTQLIKMSRECVQETGRICSMPSEYLVGLRVWLRV